jgi:superoxide dismutase, Cu-Zn family
MWRAPIAGMYRLLPAMLVLAACTHDAKRDEGPVPVAVAKLDSKSGSTVTGEAKFFSTGMETRVELEVESTMPGLHAVHLHQIGDCSDDKAESAGPHWNPRGHEHGKLDQPPAHLGDIGNIEVRQNGKGKLVFSTSRWSVGTNAENDIMGKALVIHEKADDFTSQPSGAAGDRIACGVVRKPGGVPFISSAR